MLGIIVFGLKILCMFDVLDKGFVEIIKVGYKFFDGGSGMRGRKM